MSYSQDLKKVLKLLENKKYTYKAEDDEEYNRLALKNVKTAAAKADDQKASAAGNTAGFENSYGRAAAAFLSRSAKEKNEDLKRDMEQDAKADFDKEVAALEKQAESLRKKAENEANKAAKKSSSGSSSSGKKSQSSASSAQKSEPAWNKSNADFNAIAKESNKVFSQTYVEEHKKTKSVNRSQEEGLRAQGEYIYKACDKDYTKAMAVAKAVGLDAKAYDALLKCYMNQPNDPPQLIAVKKKG